MLGLDPAVISGIVLAMVLGGLVKGTIGIGLPIASVAVLSQFLEVPLVLALVTVPIVLTNLWQAVQAGRPAEPLRRFWPMIASLLACVWLSAKLVVTLDPAVLYGLIGLAVIVLSTAFTGIIEEHRLGHAFEEALPFTALLVVFFAIVGVIHDQHLFQPVIDWVFTLDPASQVPVFYMANGVLSAISDNVFVATVYVSEVKKALDSGAITREHFDLLTVAINTGTNIPSVATPNGQAAFLFLLTSALAPLIRLSYVRMIILALPYTIVMSITGLLAVHYLL